MYQTNEDKTSYDTHIFIIHFSPKLVNKIKIDALICKESYENVRSKMKECFNSSKWVFKID